MLMNKLCFPSWKKGTKRDNWIDLCRWRTT